MRFLKRTSPIKTLKAYVFAVNNRDLGAVASLMGEEMRLVDSSGHELRGRGVCLDVVARVFANVPDYRLQIDSYTMHGDDVLMTGLSNSDARLLSTATHFRARADDRHIFEWHSFGAQPARTLAHLLATDVVEQPEVPVQPAA